MIQSVSLCHTYLETGYGTQRELRNINSKSRPSWFTFFSFTESLEFGRFTLFQLVRNVRYLRSSVRSDKATWR